VKAVFEEIGVAARYHEYEEATHAKLQKMISEVEGMPPDMFLMLLKRIYKRQK